MFYLELLGVLALIVSILIICAFAVVGVIMVFGDDMTWEELEEERKYFKIKDNENSK